MKLNAPKVLIAGVAGTVVMTMVGVFVAPMMGVPPMNPAEMLAGQMGGSMMLGWAGHFMIGVLLAAIYAIAAKYLPGPFAVRGAIFAVAPWLMAQVVMMPMMGMGLFSGSVALAGGSLMGHLLYGAVVGLVYGNPAQG